jgi:hypothetical protein
MDLCTVAQVQSFLGITDPTQDTALLQMLVSSASAFAQTYCGRTFASASYSEAYNGSGNRTQSLKHTPITAVSSLVVGRRSIQPAPIYGDQGFTFDESLLYLNCEVFWRGVQSVRVSYTAGYLDGVVTDEAVNVPAAPGPYQAPLLQGNVLRAITSLVYASSDDPLTQVAANPVQGQYALAGSVLTFNAADQGAALLASYTTNGTPPDLAQAVVEMVAIKYQKRDRMDMRSKTLAQQTIAFDNSQIPPTVLPVLNSYRRWWMPS